MTGASAKHVFISYVREDSDDVDRLCAALEAAEIPYWRDRKDLGPGDEWERVVRDAIRDGTAVFLACFSGRQRAKSKSVQNDEITIAVEEFRQRRPGKTWLIPVRFDDGDIDDWDLGAGRSMRSLNYSDLFGTRFTTEAIKLVARIQDVFGGPTSDPATVQASIEQLTDADRATKLRELTKQLILEPNKRIELDDLVRNETRRVVDTLTAQDHFPTILAAGSDIDRETVIATAATDYLRVIEPFCRSLQIAARYADKPDQLTPWTRAMIALHTHASEQTAGHTVLLNLRYIPLLAAVVTAAVATIGDSQWANFRTLLLDCTVARRPGDTATEPIAETVNFYQPFSDAGNLVPTALARAATHDQYTVATALDGLREKKINRLLQPGADWMCASLYPAFSEQFTSKDAYEKAFDHAEVMLGVTTQDAINVFEAQHPTSWPSKSAWFGRSTYRHQRPTSTPMTEYTAQLDTAGRSWPPLQAGLFGGDQQRARRAIEQYEETFRTVGRQY